MRKLTLTLITLAMLTGCTTQQVSPYLRQGVDMIPLGDDLAWIKQGLGASGRLSTNHVENARILAEFASRPDVIEQGAALVTELGPAWIANATLWQPTDPDRICMQTDLYGRAPNECMQIMMAMAKAPFRGIPLGWLDISPKSGWQERPYIEAPRSKTGLTDRGRANLGAANGLGKFAIGLFCGWSVENGKGRWLPSGGGELTGNALYAYVLEGNWSVLKECIDRYANLDLVMLDLEAQNPYAAAHALELAQRAREHGYTGRIAVSLLGPALAIAKVTPGFGADGVLLSTSHDPGCDLPTWDGDMSIDSKAALRARAEAAAVPVVMWSALQNREWGW